VIFTCPTHGTTRPMIPASAGTDATCVTGRWPRTTTGLLIREYEEREMSNQEWPIGRRIIEVRPLHKSEMDACDWEDWQDECAVCILLDDGSKLWPSADPELNTSGYMLGYQKGELYGLYH